MSEWIEGLRAFIKLQREPTGAQLQRRSHILSYLEPLREINTIDSLAARKNEVLAFEIRKHPIGDLEYLDIQIAYAIRSTELNSKKLHPYFTDKLPIGLDRLAQLVLARAQAIASQNNIKKITLTNVALAAIESLLNSAELSPIRQSLESLNLTLEARIQIERAPENGANLPSFMQACRSEAEKRSIHFISDFLILRVLLADPKLFEPPVIASEFERQNVISVLDGLI